MVLELVCEVEGSNSDIVENKQIVITLLHILFVTPHTSHLTIIVPHKIEGLVNWNNASSVILLSS